MYTAQQIIDNRKRLWKETPQDDRAFVAAVAKHILESAELQLEIARHPEHLIQMCFSIVNKHKTTTPFFLNEVQHDFVERINNAISDYMIGELFSIKFIVLKGRQQGFTSFITAYQLACTITRKNFEGFTAADEDGNTSAIFENKAKHIYTLLPTEIKPTEKFNNRRQLTFEKLHSSWEVKTASKNMGRSRTINFMHGSEAAFWKDGISGVQAGLGEALTKDAIQILESTANGHNEYKDLWDSAEWQNCFYPWWRTEEYRFNFVDEAHKATYQKEVLEKGQEYEEMKVKDEKLWIYSRCKWLVEFCNLAWEQVHWYFNKHKNYVNKELIKQEYPCSADEAFIASGKCVFNKENIIQHKQYLEKLYASKPKKDDKSDKYMMIPPKRGDFVITWHDPERLDYPLSAKWVDNANGCIRIYEDVRPVYPYVLSGDTKGEGSDRFAGTVINNNSGKRAAVLHGDMKSKYYAAQMWAIGRYYNEALIGIETNWNTYPVELLTDWHYPRQYQREIKDNFTGTLKKAFGFRTDGNTRPLIIEKEITLVE